MTTPVLTVIRTCRLRVTDPPLLILQGWRAARSQPCTAVHGTTSWTAMSEGLALALLVTESGLAAVAHRADDFGLVLDHAAALVRPAAPCLT
ncbi:hypothetical protein ACFZA9_35885 [Streptomyces olivaceus]|uniref:hypothetical protein n=1 Tax=Streptomyces olivaceus TaxID=47716 RepID=UPI0036EA9D83